LPLGSAGIFQTQAAGTQARRLFKHLNLNKFQKKKNNRQYDDGCFSGQYGYINKVWAG
jgi:hypothetical protein